MEVFNEIWKKILVWNGRFLVCSNANLPLFSKIRRFFDQMGHFCESSRTDEKNLGVLGGSLATVNPLSLFKG